MADKATLRKAMRKRRGELTTWEVETLSRAAQQHILEDKAWKKADSVGIYIAVRQETQTNLLSEAAWAEDKHLFVPYTPPSAEGDMYLLPCASEQSLVVNHFGIPEPTPESCPVPPEGGWDLPGVIIVPGLVFDWKGHRIGSGGGYYDRLFAKHTMREMIRIGLAYSFQVVGENIPAEQWDIPVHAIATEEGLTWL